MDAVLEVLKKTDWRLLDEQKAWLAGGEHAEEFGGEKAAGLLSFLDALQDAAVADGMPESVVFPTLAEEEPEPITVDETPAVERRFQATVYISIGQDEGKLAIAKEALAQYLTEAVTIHLDEDISQPAGLDGIGLTIQWHDSLREAGSPSSKPYRVYPQGVGEKEREEDAVFVLAETPKQAALIAFDVWDESGVKAGVAAVVEMRQPTSGHGYVYEPDTEPIRFPRQTIGHYPK